MGKRTWSDDQLRTAVAANTTISGTLRTLGLSTSPGNFRTIHRVVAELGLDTSHFRGKAHGTSPRATIPLENLLAPGVSYGSAKLRRRLLKLGLLKEQCSACSLGPIWQGKPLTLQLDHINGDPFDNRRENLRLLCPNCHSQTKNFCGKNISRYRKPATLPGIEPGP